MWGIQSGIGDNMKLQEIIDNIDKKHSDDVDVECFAEEFFGSLLERHGTFMSVPDEEDGKRLKCYHISTWYCTDSWVGCRAYLNWKALD